MWYLVLSRPVASRDQLAETRNAHLSWMKSQHEAGNVLFSGPTVDRSVGIYVITAASSEQAHRVADADPFHANSLRSYEMLDWEIHQILGAGPFSSEEMEFRAHRANPETH